MYCFVKRAEEGVHVNSVAPGAIWTPAVPSKYPQGFGMGSIDFPNPLCVRRRGDLIIDLRDFEKRISPLSTRGDNLLLIDVIPMPIKRSFAL
jgi:NAD(P)-dependent dehydrogenase (short-subunit alcohol dehydrogenase family)